MTSIENAHFNLKILCKKFHRISIVGIYTANARSSDYYSIRLFPFDILKYFFTVEEVQFLASFPDPSVASSCINVASYGRPNESAMPCYIDLHWTLISVNFY